MDGNIDHVAKEISLLRDVVTSRGGDMATIDSDKLEKVVTILGRSKEGIDFESLDHKPVHFVILFLVPKKDYHLHLQTLAAIAKMFTNIEIRRRLAAATCHQEILDIFAGRAAKPATNPTV
jgi:mannitol/fructose-specific phosphotransferase system IIA component (Ntr-type)